MINSTDNLEIKNDDNDIEESKNNKKDINKKDEDDDYKNKINIEDKKY